MKSSKAGGHVTPKLGSGGGSVFSPLFPLSLVALPADHSRRQSGTNFEEGEEGRPREGLVIASFLASSSFTYTLVL